MAKKSQLDKILDSIDAKIATLNSAREEVIAQQQAQAPKRKSVKAGE